MSSNYLRESDNAVVGLLRREQGGQEGEGLGVAGVAPVESQQSIEQPGVEGAPKSALLPLAPGAQQRGRRLAFLQPAPHRTDQVMYPGEALHLEHLRYLYAADGTDLA